MAPQHSPLAPIPGNIIYQKELSPHTRGKILGAHAFGVTPARISKAYRIPDQTIRDTISNAAQRPHGLSATRAGRPKSYSDRDERRIVRAARIMPKIQYAQLQKLVDNQFSTKTIQRILKDHNIMCWRAKRRPLLTEDQASVRLQWALAHIHWEEEDWSRLLWSDECSVERGRGRSDLWRFRTPYQKWDKEMIEPFNKSKDLSQMVWASFSGYGGRSKLVILARDFESKKHGYSAKSYIECLEEGLIYDYNPELIFMQDNAKIHKARATLQFLDDWGINVLEDWPPYSPDLNPIEHIWWHLKKKLEELHPELRGMGKGVEALEALQKGLLEAWDAIDESIFEGCWKSMISRCQAVIDAKGWYTKY